MLKSWKMRAAVAGVAMAAAPMALMSSAEAVPGTPTVNMLSPSNGSAGMTVTVTGTGCGTTTTPATVVELFVVGPGITTPVATPGMTSGGSAGDFSGSVLIPTTARSGEVFTVVARCSDASGRGPASSGGPTFTVVDSGLTGTGITGSTSLAGGILSGGGGSSGGTTLSGGILSGGGNTSLSGSSITSTSGNTSSTGGFGTTGFGTTGGITSGVATPINQTPRFTG